MVTSTQPPAPKGGVSGFFRRTWHTLLLYLIGTRQSFKELCTAHKKFDLKKVPRRPGEIAIITGGARGIGSEVVKKLLVLDMHIVIGCRNEQAASETLGKIRKSGVTTGSVNILQLDLLSLDSVREFAKKVMITYPKIHILINNGGIMLTPYTLTEDGNEAQFQVNYLSHFLLSNLLLPNLIRAGRTGKTSRIVNVSSVAQYGGKIAFDDINMQKMYSKGMAYMASKLMQVVYTKYLNSKLEKEHINVRVYAVHPGVIKSDLYDHVWMVTTFGFLFRMLYKTPEQGADGIVYAAISSKFEGEGGQFFANCKKYSVNADAKKWEIQKKLWELSCLMTDWENTPIPDIAKQALSNVPEVVRSIRSPEPLPISENVVRKPEKKLERQTNVESSGSEESKRNSEASMKSTSAQEQNDSQKMIITDNHFTADKPRISIVSASSSQSSVNSFDTVIGNDDVRVVIIPATATEASSSSSEDEREHSISPEHSVKYSKLESEPEPTEIEATKINDNFNTDANILEKVSLEKVGHSGDGPSDN